MSIFQPPGLRPRLAVRTYPGQLAHPTAIHLQTTGGLETHIVGGLSRLEAASIAIAAGIASAAIDSALTEIRRQDTAAQAVDLAAKVLAQCARHEEAETQAAQLAATSAGPEVDLSGIALVGPNLLAP